GWDGSVADHTAIAFAAEFYGALAGGDSVGHAVAVARRALLRQHRQDPRRFTDWHLARLYFGPAGDGRLCDPAQPTRPLPQRPARAYL
ncbi:hypothetical protein ABTN09_20715, partial [Acinetobacter baumannii]